MEAEHRVELDSAFIRSESLAPGKGRGFALGWASISEAVHPG